MRLHTKLSIFKSALVVFLLLCSVSIQADEEDSYGEIVGHKALNGFTNMTTAVLEIPKNIINTTNESNIFYGVVGGLSKGIINTLGRMTSGLTDFITAPIPTKQFVHPAYIWDDFDQDTTYGKVFRLNKEQQ